MSDMLVLEVELPERWQTVHVSPDHAQQRLTESLRRAGIALNTRCGQRGLCHGCEVELLAGRLFDLSRDQTITADDGPVVVRACQCRLATSDPVRIRVPARSLLGQGPQVVSRFTINIPRAHSPLWQIIKLDDAGVTRGHDAQKNICRALAERLNAHRTVRCPAPAVHEILRCAENAEAHIAVEHHGEDWLVTGICDRPDSPRLGAAIDIGTTTVALLLIDLQTGDILAEAADFNRQMQFGDDVVTRIELCTTDATMVHRLQEAIVSATLSPLLEQALQKAGRSTNDLRCFTIAGNTTMLHLLAGVDPTPMGTAPFTPAFLDHRVIRSDTLALPPPPHAPNADASPSPNADRAHTTAATPHRWTAQSSPAVHLLPSAAAYVGADICAGVLASGLDYDDGPSLLVDVGTNGEIVLKHKTRLLGCATAAGPAFEGCGLTSGTRATDGAISHLRFSPEPLTVRADVIGNIPPAGICGSAYIDFLAQARQIGLINRIGRFIPDALPDAAERFIRQLGTGLGLKLADGLSNRPILITEGDIARLLQAKAAIAAGILTLLARSDLSPADIKTLHLAGGFGLHVDVASAVGCGLLPGFTAPQVKLLGNSSLAGAYLALLDSGALEELQQISRRIEIVELNLDPGFEPCYIRQLRLPS